MLCEEHMKAKCMLHHIDAISNSGTLSHNIGMGQVSNIDEYT